MMVRFLLRLGRLTHRPLSRYCYNLSRLDCGVRCMMCPVGGAISLTVPDGLLDTSFSILFNYLSF